MNNPQPSWLARQLYRAAVRLYPRYDDPHHNPVPELIVAYDGYHGARLLNRVRDHRRHISIYWPGRGESYLAGKRVSRVTMTPGVLSRLSDCEIKLIESRTLAFGKDALLVAL